MPFGTTFLALRGLLAAFPAAEVVVALVYWERVVEGVVGVSDFYISLVCV